MARGSNTEKETERVNAQEINKSDVHSGRKGSGAIHFEKTGYGNNGMQQNPSTMKKPSF